MYHLIYSAVVIYSELGGVFRALPGSRKGLQSYCSRINNTKPSMWISLSIKQGHSYNLQLPLSLKVFYFSLVKLDLYEVSIYPKIGEGAITKIPGLM